MKIAYITAQTPWGRGETFIMEEMIEMKHQGIDLLIIPRNPPKEVFHKEAKELFENSIWSPMIKLGIIAECFLTLFSNFTLWRILWKILRNSRNPQIIMKNLIVFPKGIFIAKRLKKTGVSHLHAHWGSTTATIAYIISQFTNISWSFTLHRWDIYENNMMDEKVKSASFVRCISQNGKDDLLRIIGSKYADKVQVVHMGVKLSSIDKTLGASRFNNWDNPDKKFVFIVPANLVLVKGHKYLIDAFSLLLQNEVKNFYVIFYGNGPLRKKLQEYIIDKRVEEYIEMPGALPHNELTNLYKNGNVDAVILPSINTKDGEHEGIPVALMEAMAYSIPVISTNTGGIPELIGDGSGIMVEEKNAEAIVDALERLIKDKDYRYEIGRKGRLKVEKEFDIEKNVRNLIRVIKEI